MIMLYKFIELFQIKDYSKTSKKVVGIYSPGLAQDSLIPPLQEVFQFHVQQGCCWALNTLDRWVPWPLKIPSINETLTPRTYYSIFGSDVIARHSGRNSLSFPAWKVVKMWISLPTSYVQLPLELLFGCPVLFEPTLLWIAFGQKITYACTWAKTIDAVDAFYDFCVFESCVLTEAGSWFHISG